MIYTVRYAHLADKPKYERGKVFWPADIIGQMGTTGNSTAEHVHIDCVEGLHVTKYTLADIEAGSPKAEPRQLNYFIDSALFGISPVITTYYADYRYQELFGKIHPGYDVVPVDRHESKAHYAILWNRSVPGRVVAILDDPAGYGNCVYVAFEV